MTGPTGLPCPKCGDFTAVKDSRVARLGDLPSIRRRRLCTACGHRFNSYELGADVIAKLEQRLAAAEQLRRAARNLTAVTAHQRS